MFWPSGWNGLAVTSLVYFSDYHFDSPGSVNSVTMMSTGQTRIAEAQKKPIRARPQEQRPALQHEQLREQAVMSWLVYRRAQISGNGLRSADLLAMELTVGNRRVQRNSGRTPEGFEPE
jgi:hypothetical protein